MSFGFALQPDHRYEVEYFLPKHGRHCVLSNARLVTSKQQHHLVGYDGKHRRSLGGGTVVLRITVLLPIRTPVAT